MPTTTLKLPEELGARVAAVVDGTGQSADAFMVAAIERQTRLAEQRRSFVADALVTREDAYRSGLGYSAGDVHRYMRARARGEKAARPRPRKWRK